MWKVFPFIVSSCKFWVFTDQDGPYLIYWSIQFNQWLCLNEFQWQSDPLKTFEGKESKINHMVPRSMPLLLSHAYEKCNYSSGLIYSFKLYANKRTWFLLWWLSILKFHTKTSKFTFYVLRYDIWLLSLKDTTILLHLHLMIYQIVSCWEYCIC